MNATPQPRRRVRAVQVNPAVPAPKVTATRKPRTPKVAAPIKEKPTKAKAAPLTDAQRAWRKATRKAKAEHWENMFALQWQAKRLPQVARNALFLDGFNYRGDFVLRADKIVVEIDGGVGMGQMNQQQQQRWLQNAALLALAGETPKWPTQGGHHNNPKGYRYDRIRDCEAILQGWTVLRFPPDMVEDGSAIEYVERVLHAIWARNKRTA